MNQKSTKSLQFTEEIYKKFTVYRSLRKLLRKNSKIQKFLPGQFFNGCIGTQVGVFAAR